jgi:hypothetical protein
MFPRNQTGAYIDKNYCSAGFDNFVDSTNIANAQSFTETSDIIGNLSNYEEIVEGQSELSD